MRININIEEFRKFAEDNFFIHSKACGEVKFRLRESQEILLDAIEKAVSNGKRGVLVGLNRQIGASSALSAMAFYNALDTAGHNIVIAECNKEMAAMRLGAMKATADKLPSVIDKKDGFVVHHEADGDSCITVTTEPQIQKLRGIRSDITLLIIESVNFWKEANIKALLEMAEQAFVVMVLLPSIGSESDKIWDSYGTEWERLFIPWYVEMSRQLPPPDGWEPQEYETKMASRVQAESGVELSNAQLYWYERKRKNASHCDIPARLLRQELSTTFHDAASAE